MTNENRVLPNGRGVRSPRQKNMVKVFPEPSPGMIGLKSPKPNIELEPDYDPSPVIQSNQRNLVKHRQAPVTQEEHNFFYQVNILKMK